MFGLLLVKDLRRARRNPLPWVVNLVIPLAMVGMFGLAFGGGGGGGGGLGRVRFAVVDEDGSTLVRMLRGALTQDEAARTFDPVFLDRGEALAELEADRLSAVVVIPKGFTEEYLSGRPVRLHVVKNPAQSVHPAVIEEGLGVLVAALNGVSRSFGSILPEVRAVLDGEGGYKQLAALIERTGDRLVAARQYLDPPLIGYDEEVRPGAAPPRRKFQVFAYLLVGLAAMFLLFLAGTGMRDLLVEIQAGTLERYHTVRHDLWRFLAAKIAFVTVMVLLCGGILFGGGGLVFGIEWQHPWILAALVAAYGTVAAGLMAVVMGLAGDERRASVLGNVVSMALALVGGAMFPPEQLPAFLREELAPWVPTYWFASAVRRLELDAGAMAWPTALALLSGLGLFLLAASAVLFRRRFAHGVRA